MIAHLRGRVIHRHPAWLILEVGGVGYRVLVPGQVQGQVGDEIELSCSLQVREDSLTLYGFPSLADQELFALLLTVSGVGPKNALAIMSSAPAARIQAAIAQGDTTLFEAVSGIGKKVAAKIIVELKSKVGGG